VSPGPGLQLVAHPASHEVDDLGDLGPGQFVEDDHVVDAVQELGRKWTFRASLTSPSCARTDRLVGLVEADVIAQVLGAGLDVMISTLRVDRAALAVGEAPFLQDLQGVLNTSGWAFSISSNSTTEKACAARPR
jgi:hypothetical protein